ncbi:hypothetical protein KI688_003048 [Linnemannia hyalina]|uniref:F-box/LRR-repeat protein 15/At3g58940/PEG3-like LRR domain-containing protein n=1 Tax=Linnemannia hyalina TaxID=64524 RepID=A0A9P7XPP6_9FUNG|nr:hypothetical protein KI688_003048 [Linnemannia hyalina]
MQLPSSSPPTTTSHSNANSQSRNHLHAFHIPEITSIIVSSLTQLDIIHCRGVSLEWRRLFSPFLKLHGLYRIHNPVLKTLFEEQLQSLGPFVYSLKQVVPIPQDLEVVQQTCPRLGHVGFYVQRKQSMHFKALVRFLESMHVLESIAFYSFDDSMVTTLLQGLATYQHQQPPTAVKTSTALSPSTASTPSSSPALRKLEIGNAAHSLKFARIQWEQVMLVLLKHPEMNSLALRDAHLCWYQDREDPSTEDWSRNVLVRAVFGAETQRQWNGLLSKLGSWRLGGSRTNLTPELSSLRKSGCGSGSSTTANSDATTPVQFSKMTHLVLDGMRISEDLLCYILNRCPALKSLELSLGSTISSQFWAGWLLNCPQLESVKVKSSSGSVNIDIPNFWSLAPTTLTTFQFASDRRQLTFPELSPLPSLTNFAELSNDRCHGSTLVTLELDIGLRVADRGLPYIMTNCRSLVSLVIGIQYFADWEHVNDGLGGGGGNPVSPTTATQPRSFPPWSCGRTLKNLELRVFYLPQDLQFDERIHVFMRRLDDLRVLESLSLPLKLLSDLSESQHEDYSGFNLGVLEHLEQQALLNEQFPTQATVSVPTQDLSLGGSMAAQSQLQQQAGAYRNVLPQMPSVQEVVLSSSGSFRFQIRMRHLHILMEALSGLTTVWVAPGLCGLDPLPWFKQLHDRFQAQYGSRGVALHLGSPAWGE